MALGIRMSKTFKTFQIFTSFLHILSRHFALLPGSLLSVWNYVTKTKSLGDLLYVKLEKAGRYAVVM